MKYFFGLPALVSILFIGCAKPESTDSYGRFESVSYESEQLSFQVKRASTAGIFEAFVISHNGQTVNALTSLVSTTMNRIAFDQLTGTLDGLIPINGLYSGGSTLELYANVGGTRQRITNNDTRTILQNLAGMVYWRLPLLGPYTHIIHRFPGFQFTFDHPSNNQLKVSVLRFSTGTSYEVLLASNSLNAGAIARISGILAGTDNIHGESPVDIGDPRYTMVTNSNSESSLLTVQDSLDLITGLETEILDDISN